MSATVAQAGDRQPLVDDRSWEQTRARFREVGARFQDAARHAYAERRFAAELWQGAVEAGLLELVDGEPGPSLAALAAAMEGLTQGSRDGGFLIVPITHCALGMHVLREEANREIRDHYLGRLATGKELLAFAITEPAGGTDAFRPNTTLSADGGRLLLSGEKWHITSAPHAAMSIVWAADPAYGDIAGVVVEHDWPGVEVSPPLRPAGT
ncbi:MAG: acyl-CoA dehydrogenase family protein, partial [Mycobacterium sp.]